MALQPNGSLADQHAMTEGAERRRSPRTVLAAFAALEAQGRHHNDQAFASVADVSRVGIAVHTGQPPIPGQQVVVRIALGEEIHEVTTTVTRVTRRSADLFDVGLDWSHCDPTTLEFLERVFEQAESHDPQMHEL